MTSDEKEKSPPTIQEIRDQRFTLEERLKPLTEDDWCRGIYLKGYWWNPLLADCFATWLKENGESTEIPDMNTSESTGVTVEEIAERMRRAPTPLMGDPYVKTFSQEVEDAVRAKFHELIDLELWSNYMDFLADWDTPLDWDDPVESKFGKLFHPNQVTDLFN